MFKKNQNRDLRMCIVLIAIVIFLATTLVTTTVHTILNPIYIRRIRLHHKKTVSLTSIFSKSAGTNMADSHKYKVICAATRMCRMIAGLNLPLTATEAITHNVKLMFPDSKIVQGNGHFSFQVILQI